MSLSNLAGFASAGLQLGVSSLLVKPKRGIFPSDGSPTFIPQATIEERSIDDLEITEHPVEQGANIADHAYKRPSEVIIKAAWSNSPAAASGVSGLLGAAVSAASASIPAVNQAVNVFQQVQGVLGTINAISSSQSGADQSQMNTIYANLIKLQVGGNNGPVLCDIYTGRRVYSNMLIRSISLENDFKTENALFLVITCRQVILVNTQVVSISSASDGSINSPVNGGLKNLLPNPSSFQLPPIPSITDLIP